MITDKQFFKKDKFATRIGINIEEFSQGYAKVSLKINTTHLNGVNIVHGGVLFTLADYALAIASNAYGKVALSINANITYLKSSNSGIITATAKEISKGSKIATYQVNIINDKKEKLAVVQGTVYITDSKISI